MNAEIPESLVDTPLFSRMDVLQIQRVLNCSCAQMKQYSAGSLIFCADDTPEQIHILYRGRVIMGQDSSDGRRVVTAQYDACGDLFGEITLLSNDGTYGRFAEAATDTQVLTLPKSLLYTMCPRNCDVHSRLIANMLGILAQKAQYLNQRVYVLESHSLREKIAKTLLRHCGDDPQKPLSVSREHLAEHLAVARPSLSRELSNMQADGLIRLDGREIYICDYEKVRALA